MVTDSEHGVHRIVIVGGGAGGLELATRLGDKLGKGKKAHVTLIEKKRNHFWKPHLHEIAAGSMDIGVYQTNYLAQAHWHHFRYRIGEMTGLDRAQRTVMVAPFTDEDGDRVTPAAHVSLRHARPRRGEPHQRLRHAGRQGACDCAGDAARRRALPPPARERLPRARMRNRVRCAPISSTSSSSAPARPASSSPPSCTTRRARWSRTASTASIPRRTSS